MNRNKPWIFNPSTILGLLSAVLLTLGMTLPAIDFSHFHKSVDIQYNLMKICENVGLISSLWTGIPYGIIIGIVALVILSFTKIPVLKILPSLLVTAMVVLMLVDMENVISWVSNVLQKFSATQSIKVDIQEVFKSFMPGIYLLACGILTSYISCFFKIKE
ncbi:MAG: hypothetical protein NC225_08705 [Clostridium sp.]|nr:hypothetical protein [Clostridium sp.]MCM1460097.1 hypothetical protein [Bacteroides sp.]